mgnify:CR=1 FL=1
MISRDLYDIVIKNRLLRGDRVKQNYKKTMYACFIGYVVQAIVNNFAPLLFVTFQNSYRIPLSKITALITVNFIIQLLIDLASAKFIDKIGYRAAAVIAHIFSAAGLALLTVLPDLFSNAYMGIVIAVAVYAVGGGLLEVLVSPIMQACPTDNKEKAMSLLHSFYCWGHVGVVLASTVFFAVAGIENWKILALIWAVIPVLNAVLFLQAPMYSLHAEGERGLTAKELFSKKIFWVFVVMMACAGASEQTVSQWASTFAEQGLGVSKTIGDLAGPMAFALFMGLSRLIYGRYGDRLNLDRIMKGSCVLCIASYLGIAWIPIPMLSLVGCAVCGFSVGILWPGTFSKAAVSIKGGGTVLFAMLALAGDLGCSGGPTLAGAVSSLLQNNLHMGILAAIVFPIFLWVGISVLGKKEERDPRSAKKEKG